jgi:hypothetical protein
LIGSGSISHLQAMEKAESEYKKYKDCAISDVKNDYLETIRSIENISTNYNKQSNKQSVKLVMIFLSNQFPA